MKRPPDIKALNLLHKNDNTSTTTNWNIIINGNTV
jgi:hypothetical protein